MGYLFLGQGEVMDTGKLVGVFDLDQVSASSRTREFLERSEGTGQVRVLGDNIPLSLVVTEDGCVLSPISSGTLCKRLAEDKLM